MILPFKQITFNEEEHRYFDDDGIEYTSVTTLLHEKFDGEAIAARVIGNPRSKYYGMTKENVLAQWSRSAPLGTIAHKAIEDYINDKTLPEDPELIPLVTQFSKLNFRGKLISEIIVHDEDYLIAGMADIIEVCNKELWLWDIKTSVPRPKGDRISDDKMEKYSKQLELYKRLIEKCFQMPCNIGGIIWLKDFAKQRENTKLEVFRTKDRSEFVDGLLQKRRFELINNA